MIPCISQASTLSTAFEDDLPAFSRAGWPAVEIWMTKLETYLRDHTLAEARAILADNGIVALAGASQGGLLINDPAARKEHQDSFQRRLESVRSLGAKTLVITGDFAAAPTEGGMQAILKSLERAGDLAAKHDVRLALEFQKNAKFCASLDTALALVTQCGTPHVGVCLDLFHYYTGPSKFEDLGYLSAENLAWVQVCDLSGVPRELAGDSDRILPGDGDFAIRPILDHVASIGYRGGISLEVLNPTLWHVAAPAFADAGLRALGRFFEPVGEPSQGRA